MATEAEDGAATPVEGSTAPASSGVSTAAAAVAALPFAIEASLCAKVSFATHQGAVPVLRELRVISHRETACEDLQLEVSADPPIFVPRVWKLDRLQPGSSIAVRDRDLQLNAGFLLGLKEAVQARVSFKLWPGDTRSEAVEPLANESCSIDVLAAGEWGGAGSMAELLAMFVQPNDPAIARILKAAAEVLRNAGKPDDLDGYKGQSRTRSYELASAIWSAISALRLTYVLPPASFETQGQKIRLPQLVLEQGLATCLDTALLFAGALEQTGLNAVLILTEGHAFTGVWLQPQEFASLLTEDASALRKRVALQELLLFETTLCTGSNRVGFAKAVAEGNRQIAEDRETQFVLALDLRRARMQRLRPLALPNLAAPGLPDTAPSAISDTEPGLEAAPALPAFDVTDADTPSTPEGRLQRWQRKLLDLTTRNRLLHAPAGASGIPLLCPDPGGLEDELASGKSFRVLAAPHIGKAPSAGTPNCTGTERAKCSMRRMPPRRCAGARYWPCSRSQKLDAQLVELFRKSRLDLAEGGSNTLFLAVGFLNWKKTAGRHARLPGSTAVTARQARTPQRTFRCAPLHAG